MPLHASPKILPLGDAAVTVQFGDEVSEDAHQRVSGFIHALERAVQAGQLHGVVEWVPAYASVTVIVDDPDEAAAQRRDDALLKLAQDARAAPVQGQRWLLPVCFDADLAPDLDALASARELTRVQAIDHLLGAHLLVYMIGFMPGFPYMGGLPESLALPRRTSPRLVVPPRSIAVAGRMCGIYPWPSPGGWHLVGSTPVAPFDARRGSPSLLRAGDRVRFRAVDRATYGRLHEAAERGNLDPLTLIDGAEA